MNELTIRPPEDDGSEYPLLRLDSTQELLDVFRENMGSAGIGPQDLMRIKVPSGGALHWNVMTPDGAEAVKEIEGIILAWRPSRLYWKMGLDEGGGRKPPDCSSKDSFIGIGDPGGQCALCPNAQFGSASKGHGQACKQVRQMLLVRPGETLPHLISIPPTSLKAASQYFMMLAARPKPIPYWGVVTKMRLEKATSEGRIDYAKVQFFQGQVLSPEERRMLGPFHKAMEQMLAPITVDARDYTERSAPIVDLNSPTSRGVFSKPAQRAPAPDPDPPFYSGPDPESAKPDPSDDDIPF